MHVLFYIPWFIWIWAPSYVRISTANSLWSQLNFNTIQRQWFRLNKTPAKRPLKIQRKLYQLPPIHPVYTITLPLIHLPTWAFWKTWKWRVQETWNEILGRSTSSIDDDDDDDNNNNFYNHLNNPWPINKPARTHEYTHTYIDTTQINKENKTLWDKGSEGTDSISY